MRLVRGVHSDPSVIGWREWVGLPELGVPRVKAKVDTGARSSALHAFSIATFERDNMTWVRFIVHPRTASDRPSIAAEALLEDERWIRSSNGTRQLRPVIRTDVQVPAGRWSIDVTLTDRDVMGFRMLLGREAIRGRFLVDPGRSFLLGRTKKGVRPR